MTTRTTLDAAKEYENMIADVAALRPRGPWVRSPFDAYVQERPTEMLLRQLKANRNAARYRNPETGKRHHAHIPHYRRVFVLEMLAMRRELRKRKEGRKHGGY